MPRSRARSLSIGAPILAVSARFRLRCIHFLFDSCSHTRRAHRSAPPGRRPIRQSTCRAFSGHWVQTSRFIAALTGEPLPRLPQAALAASIGSEHWQSSTGATRPRSHDVCLRSSTTNSPLAPPAPSASLCRMLVLRREGICRLRLLHCSSQFAR